MGISFRILRSPPRWILEAIIALHNRVILFPLTSLGLQLHYHPFYLNPMYGVLIDEPSCHRISHYASNRISSQYRPASLIPSMQCTLNLRFPARDHPVLHTRIVNQGLHPSCILFVLRRRKLRKPKALNSQCLLSNNSSSCQPISIFV